jgi:hypothetical protein
MDSATIARTRAESLLRRFAGQGVPPVIVLSPGLIDVTAYRFGCTKTPVGTRSMQEAFALIHPNDPLMSTVWALPKVRGYKKIYEQFLELAYGLKGAKAPAAHDVDHLRAKAITPANCFIRLEAVGKSSNRSHGGGFESQMKDSVVTQARKDRGHVNGSMSWMVALKLAGVLSPLIATNPDAAQRRAAAIAVFSKMGFSRAEIEQGLDSLQELAAR